MFKFLLILGAIFFAVIILVVSIFRNAAPRYAFYQPEIPNQEQNLSEPDSSYVMPDPGISPNNPLWFLKATRDKVWLTLTFHPGKRAHLLILFADKRVLLSQKLLKEGDVELSVATAWKAEQYLLEALNAENEAYDQGMETAELAETLAKSSLKHIEILENNINFAPEDAKPTLLKILDTPRDVYEKSVQRLNAKGKDSPLPRLDPKTN